MCWWELGRLLPSTHNHPREVLTPRPRAPRPFLRAVEAQSETHPEGKERLVGKIQEPQEAIKFPKKQAEAEEEVESILRQEASRLSLENRVREV